MMRRALILALLALAWLSAPGIMGRGHSAELANVARQYVGLSEQRNRAYLRRLMGFDPVRTPWCGGFAGVVARRAGVVPPAAFPAARSWRSWRRPSTCSRNAVAVFRGHVAIVTRTDGRWVWVIGGNQRNGVTEKRVARAKILTCRR